MTGLFLQPEGFYQEDPAVLEPEMIASPVPGFPERGISCFSKRLVEFLVDRYDGVSIAFFRTEEGKIPIYKISWNGEEIALFMSRVGAPAAVIQLEEVRSMGLRKIFYFGSCGALDRQIGFGDLILPLGGIRDEGTSYHYQQPEWNARMKEGPLEIIRQELTGMEMNWREGLTWTTDGLYRETRSKVDQRIRDGCLVVEMEYTALQAAADFRKMVFGQLLYCEDNLDGEDWEARGYLPGDPELMERWLELPFRIVTRF